ncbi:hypothetical protein J6590_021204 [Homalodisca vitripennis]|nr:hypothetical protein J6590_021204 [Homalodisca vitripennis]
MADSYRSAAITWSPGAGFDVSEKEILLKKHLLPALVLYLRSKAPSVIVKFAFLSQWREYIVQLKSYCGSMRDFRTNTNGRAAGLLAMTGYLSGYPSKQQPRSTLLDPVILLYLYPLHYAIRQQQEYY